MNILYIINKKKNNCSYYIDIIKYISKYNQVKTINFDEINEKNDKLDIITKESKTDIIIIGFDLTNSGNKAPKFFIYSKDIPLYILLNKEYTGLKSKLKWISKLKPKKVFTVHHKYKQFQKKINIPFTRIMWSANDSIFKKYNDDYIYDLFFSGVIRQNQTNNLRFKIYEKLHLIKNYKLLIKPIFINLIPKNKLEENYKSKKLSYKKYAEVMNNSKIVLTTTGPSDIVGTRYFEIMATNKALIMCNRMPKNVYEDIVIDKFNCIMFDNENDFIKKVKYYLKNENERIQIVNNAYKYFLENHTWDHKVKHLISNI